MSDTKECNCDQAIALSKKVRGLERELHYAHAANEAARSNRTTESIQLRNLKIDAENIRLIRQILSDE